VVLKISKTLQEVQELAKKGNAIPIYHEMMADLETPITALFKLEASLNQQQGLEAPHKSLFLLESVEGGESLARYSFLGRNPLYTFCSKGNQVSISGRSSNHQNRSLEGKPLEELKAFFSQFHGVPDPNLPNFAGGGVGYVSYDAIRLIEDIPQSGEDTLQIDDIHIGIFDTFIVFDNVKHKMYLVSNVLSDVYGDIEKAYEVAVNNIEALHLELSQGLESPKYEAKPSPEWHSNVERSYYDNSIETCREYIQAGDAFQIVFSQRFSAKTDVEATRVYRALRTVNPSPYMYYLKLDDMEIVGASPELLVKVQNGVVQTRPIAGSRPRGKTLQEDLDLEKNLLADEKERAEHVMLVDLGRNDAGRVSEYGSVQVTDFMVIERYSHIMHIVSNVEGTLKEGIHCLDAMMSCFPAGTLSGAPKIRAMEIIDELEPHKRGVYGGAICYLDFNGNLDSCIAIRTMVLKDGMAHVQAGGGIVADSIPETEYLETKNKAAAVMRAVDLACGLEH
jgi:anthranilate synthase component 1